MRVGLPGALGFLALFEFTAMIALSAAGMAAGTVGFFKKRAHGWIIDFTGEKYLLGSLGVMFLTSFMLLLFTESDLAYGALLVLALAASFLLFAKYRGRGANDLSSVSVVCLGAALACAGSISGLSVLAVLGAALAAETASEIK
jgi:hypothetical protein